MFSNVEIGVRISSARSMNGLTLEEVASKVGVAKSTILRYEKGSISKVKLPVIESIAHALSVDPNWLIGNSESPTLTDRVMPHELSDDEKKIVDYYRCLNYDGQKKLLDYADDLASSGKYEKSSSLSKEA